MNNETTRSLPTKTRLPQQDLLVCVLARHKLCRFFFGKTLSTTDIAPACYSGKIYNNPGNFELPKFILAVEIKWCILFCGFRGGNKNFAEIRIGSFSRLAATSRALVLQREHARKLHLPGHILAAAFLPSLFTKVVFKIQNFFFFLLLGTPHFPLTGFHAQPIWHVSEARCVTGAPQTGRLCCFLVCPSWRFLA